MTPLPAGTGTGPDRPVEQSPAAKPASGTAEAGAPDSRLSRITPERTIAIVAFAVVFAIGASLRLDPDVWWHLRAGAVTLHDGVIRRDTFSFTKAGMPWIDHSWGAEVIGYLIWRVGGWAGLGILTGALAAIGGWFVYRMSSGGTYVRAFAVAVASLTASVFWAPRPQMFSYALTGAVLYILFLRRHAGVDRLWWLPLLMLLWANLHGGFAIGFILMGGVILGETLENLAALDDRGHLDWRAVRKLGLVAAVSVGAVCVNPYGPRLLAVPFETAGGSFTTLIEEWRPPDFHNQGFWPFAALLVVFVLAGGASRHRIGWTDWILCSGSTLLALSAGRNVSIFAIVVTPVLTYHLATVLEDQGWVVQPLQRATRPIALLNLALVVVVVGIAAERALAPLDARTLRAAERRESPVDAVAFLRSHGVRGHLFNQYEWGGYLIHELPRVPVFVDGRSDLYGGAFLSGAYGAVAGGGPLWSQQLDRYGVGTVLVRSDSGLASVLETDPGWRAVYTDTLARVFERRGGSE